MTLGLHSCEILGTFDDDDDGGGRAGGPLPSFLPPLFI